MSDAFKALVKFMGSSGFEPLRVKIPKRLLYNGPSDNDQNSPSTNEQKDENKNDQILEDKKIDLPDDDEKNDQCEKCDEDENSNLNTIALVFLSERSDSVAAKRCGRREYDCHVCETRVDRLCNLSDVNGDPLLMTRDKLDRFLMSRNDVTLREKECWNEICDYAKQEVQRPIEDVLILLQNETIYNMNMRQGMSYSGYYYNHWHVEVPPELRTDPNIPQETLDLIFYAIKRYFVEKNSEGFLIRKIRLMIDQGVESLDLLEKCLHNTSYGFKFLYACRWMRSILKNLQAMNPGANLKEIFDQMGERRRWAFCLEQLLIGGLQKESNSGAVCPVCQTSDQLLGLMADANNEEHMIKLCTDRLSPDNYKRPKAEASVTQIRNTQQILGDFENSMATIDELIDMVPETRKIGSIIPTSNVNPHSSSAGFATQLKKKGNFASRNRIDASHNVQQQIKQLDTLSDLYDFVDEIEKKQNIKLDIELASSPTVGSAMYITKSTIKPELLKYRHMWAFLKDVNPSSYSMRVGSKITHIVPCWKYIKGYSQCLLVVDGAKPSHGVTVANSCFPEFIAGEYERVCRTAFEGLNHTMKLRIPSSQPLAFGIGLCKNEESGKLTDEITLKINGYPKVFTHLYHQQSNQQLNQ